MRLYLLIVLSALALSGATTNPAAGLWDELEAKRRTLGAVHQEFNLTETYKAVRGQWAFKGSIVLDMDGERWRENGDAASGGTLRICDGHDLFRTEEGGDEYVRTKMKSDDDQLRPQSYRTGDLDLARTAEILRRPCGLGQLNHSCVLVQAPMKMWQRQTGYGQTTRLLEGTRTVLMDLESGLILSAKTVQVIQSLEGGHRLETLYTLKTLRYGGPADPSLFVLPAGLHEAKALSQWDAARIRKVLVGNMAPNLSLVDIQGKAVTLLSLRGRTVLLDFWTTWCPPCRKDAPELDRIYQKYGAKDLTIVGISVSEERSIVEKFLKDHPHAFPVALTAENEMPRPFQIAVFPTYIVIDSDGKVAGAVEGDQGFGELRKLLRKAGLETE